MQVLIGTMILVGISRLGVFLGLPPQVVSGGITNQLLKLTPSPSSVEEPILVRIFGLNTEVLIDRAKEIQNLIALNKFGFGARVLGTFSNGRIEQFLPSRTLDPTDLGREDTIPWLARRMAQFHSLKMPPCGHRAHGTTDGIPEDEHHFISHQSDIKKDDNIQDTQDDEGDDDDGPLSKMQRWLEMARHLDFSEHPPKAQAFAAINLDEIAIDVENMLSFVRRVPSKKVFAHNDLLAGNILILGDRAYPSSTDDIQFIDFEYGSYGPRGTSDSREPANYPVTNSTRTTVQRHNGLASLVSSLFCRRRLRHRQSLERICWIRL